MDSAPLNQAHLYHRKAETHLKYKRFEEAALCHQTAADKLEEAMQLTRAPQALDSLRLQQDFHIRQQDIVKLKKTQYEMYKKTLETQQQNKMTRILTGKSDGSKESDTHSSLQSLIYRNIEMADSLLEVLYRRGEDDLTNEESEPEVVNKCETDGVIGKKQPKDDRVVIEELHTLNQQLRKFVMQLSVQLEEKENENAKLKENVRVLEEVIMGQKTETPRKNSLHAITDSSGDNSSLFVLSPPEELSPDGMQTIVHDDVQHDSTEKNEHKELLTLAPLEMPVLDFSFFMKPARDKLGDAIDSDPEQELVEGDNQQN